MLKDSNVLAVRSADHPMSNPSAPREGVRLWGLGFCPPPNRQIMLRQMRLTANVLIGRIVGGPILLIPGMGS